jgi:hypothetical protein
MKEHYESCPQSQSNEHTCPSMLRLIGTRMYQPTIEHDNGRWQIYLVVQGIHSVTIPIEYCPFCGEELPGIKCICDDIQQGLREQEIYYKTDGRLP